MTPRHHAGSMAAVTCAIALTVLLPSLGSAKNLGGGGGAEGRIEGDFKFLPIPYINYDRSIGFQLGALPMAMFDPVRNDTLAPSSIAGLFGMYTTNETWFVSSIRLSSSRSCSPIRRRSWSS